MKIAYKNISYLIVGFLLLALLFANFSAMPISANAASVYRGDYISIYYDVNSYSGKVSWTLEFGLNTSLRVASSTERDLYHTKIREMVQEIFNEKKEELRATYLANPDEKYNPSECITHSIGAVLDVEADNVSFMFQFKDVETYNFYNKKYIGENREENNIFFKKQINESIFPFAEIVTDGLNETTLARYYKNKFISACQGLTIENSIKLLYEPQFIYDFTTLSSRLKTNADLNYTDASGKYHHAWGDNANNINSSFVMTKTFVKVNTGWWYLLAITIPLLCMTIAIVVIVIKEKRKRNIEKDEKTA